MIAGYRRCVNHGIAVEMTISPFIDTQNTKTLAPQNTNLLVGYASEVRHHFADVTRTKFGVQALQRFKTEIPHCLNLNRESLN